MKKIKNLLKIKNAGIIAVIRADDEISGKNICNSILKGGIKALEITFTIPNAKNLISELKYLENDEIIIGAGSVLDEITARIAIMSGASFIVSPIFDKNIAKICNFYQIPYIPGCMTITEASKALEYGSDIIKLFPANTYEPKVIFSFKAPIPYLNIMPTGGVDISNIKNWFDSGAIAVGIGGNLTKGSYIDIENKAKKYIEEFKKINEKN